MCPWLGWAFSEDGSPSRLGGAYTREMTYPSIARSFMQTVDRDRPEDREAGSHAEPPPDYAAARRRGGCRV